MIGLHSRQPKLGGRSLDITRKDSIRSTVSEKLTFEEEIRFFDSRLSAVPSEQLASTPEVRVVVIHDVLNTLDKSIFTDGMVIF